MCLAVPSQIVEIKAGGDFAVMETLGVKQDAVIALLDGSVQPGDYVLVHAGFAIRKIDTGEALKTLQLHEELRRKAGFSFEKNQSPEEKTNET